MVNGEGQSVLKVNRLIYFSTLSHLNGLVYANQTLASVQNGKSKSHIPAESLLRFGKNWEWCVLANQIRSKRIYAKQ